MECGAAPLRCCAGPGSQRARAGAVRDGSSCRVPERAGCVPGAQITIYVEHPVPRDPPAEAPPPPPQPLKLTKKEQKKLRTQRRVAREKARVWLAALRRLSRSCPRFFFCVADRDPGDPRLAGAPRDGQAGAAGAAEAQGQDLEPDEGAHRPGSRGPDGHRDGGAPTFSPGAALAGIKERGIISARFGSGCVDAAVSAATRSASKWRSARTRTRTATSRGSSRPPRRRRRRRAGAPRSRPLAPLLFAMRGALWRMLTSPVRWDVQERKLFADTTGEVETICCVYRVERMTHPQNKYKARRGGGCSCARRAAAPTDTRNAQVVGNAPATEALPWASPPRR